MKKILSIILVTLIFMSILMPLTVVAANGPFQTDWENATEDSVMALISFADHKTGEISFLYPQRLDEEQSFVNSKNIKYDEKTNTLTLNNFKTEEIMVLTAMGDDFKINVTGYNEIGCIISTAMTWGGSITITGSGVLVINKNSNFPEAVSIDAAETEKAFFKVEKNVAIQINGHSENGEKYPAVSVYGVTEPNKDRVVKFAGKIVKGEASKTEQYVVNTYEQEKVQKVTIYDGDGTFLQKGGKYYIAEKTTAEGLYDIAEIVYDDTLKSYIILPVEQANKGVTFYGYTWKNPAEFTASVLERSQYVNMNVCIDERDKKCVFVDYSDKMTPGKNVRVYDVLNHPKYGNLAIFYSYKTTYKELKITGTKTMYDHINYSEIILSDNVVSTVPQKVGLLKAENAYGGVKITWKPVENATDYIVYRKAEGAKKWTSVGSTAATSYLDKTAQNQVKYTYTVRARNALGLGGFDKNGVSTKYIAAPTVKNANTSSGIQVSWTTVQGATGYTVYRSQYINGKWSTWQNMGTAKSTKTSWIDKRAGLGCKYRYTVRALSNGVRSGYRATTGIVYLKTPNVKIANASTGVRMVWSNILGAKQYTIYRSEYNQTTKKWESWKNLGTVSARTGITDTTVQSGKYYRYAVRAVSDNSRSSYKTSNSVFYLAQPEVKAENSSNGIKVSWSEASGASGYTVYRSEFVNGKWSSWKNMGTAPATKFSWVDRRSVKGVQYRYTVRAVYGSSRSTYAPTEGITRTK